MSKSIIKVIIGKKKMVRKVELDMKLNEFRISLKDNMPESSSFIMEDATIEKEDESEFSIKDILKDKEVHCSLNADEISIYLNDENILKLNINTNDKIEFLLNELKDKISKECLIKFEDAEMTLEEAKEQGFTIKELLSQNSIYFVNHQQKTEPNNSHKEKNNKNKENEKFIHIYKNGDIIKMTLLDLNNKISTLRELLKEEISDKAKFLSEGVGVPIKDEQNLSLLHIIKEDKIYIEENNKKDSDSDSNTVISKKEQEKIQIQQDKIPIILKFGDDSTSITKSSLSEKLDTFREDNNISDNFIFTFNGTEIKKKQEKTFTIDEIINKDSNSVILKNLKPKKK